MGIQNPAKYYRKQQLQDYQQQLKLPKKTLYVQIYNIVSLHFYTQSDLAEESVRHWEEMLRPNIL